MAKADRAMVAINRMFQATLAASHHNPELLACHGVFRRPSIGVRSNLRTRSEKAVPAAYYRQHIKRQLSLEALEYLAFAANDRNPSLTAGPSRTTLCGLSALAYDAAARPVEAAVHRDWYAVHISAPPPSREGAGRTPSRRGSSFRRPGRIPATIQARRCADRFRSDRSALQS